MNIPLSRYDINEDVTFRTSSGSSAGVEGAYFWNPYFGVGGRFSASTTHIITTDNGKKENKNGETVAEGNTLDAVTVMAGPYFSYPISTRWNVGTKLLAGYIAYQQLELSDGLSVPKSCGATFGSGISLSYKARERYGIRFFLDYNLQPSHSEDSGEWMNTLTAGMTFGVNF